MARNLFRRFMPRPETLQRNRSLRFLGKWLHDPNLWHLNRHSVAKAVFIGFAVAFVPLPVHILLAGTLAVWWRANLPLSLAGVWISNPITIPAQFYVAYKLGSSLLRQPPMAFDFQLSLNWLGSEFTHVWQPLLLGCLLCGLAVGLAGALAVRILWRWQVVLRWRARQRQRAMR